MIRLGIVLILISSVKGEITSKGCSKITPHSCVKDGYDRLQPGQNVKKLFLP
jgi:hypothetical protein